MSKEEEAIKLKPASETSTAIVIIASFSLRFIFYSPIMSYTYIDVNLAKKFTIFIRIIFIVNMPDT